MFFLINFNGNKRLDWREMKWRKLRAFEEHDIKRVGGLNNKKQVMKV